MVLVSSIIVAIVLLGFILWRAAAFSDWWRSIRIPRYSVTTISGRSRWIAAGTRVRRPAGTARRR